MTENSCDERYDAAAIFFHWASVALVLAAILFGWAVRLTPTLLTIHRSLGISALAMTVLRLVWRATHPAPPLPGSLRRWQQWLAAGTHWLLYGLLFAMPVTGYVATTAGNHPASFFYLFALPHLIAPDPVLAGLAYRTHVTLQWALYALVGLHAAAALGHHFVIKDNVLRRILPALPRRSPVNFLREVHMKPGRRSAPE